MEEPWILAEQEAQLADRQRKRRPVCADCGRRIAKGWAFELDKGILTRKEKDGETVFEIQKGKGKGLVDRNGLKQLTGVLKDLQDILCQDDLTTRERELKLKRLEMELSGAADSGITVELMGEAHAYAQ